MPLSAVVPVFVLLLALVDVHGYLGPFGPPYPITAAWFRDRYSGEEWNQTLAEFAKQGGDTVLLKAPSITIVSKQDLHGDPDFQWCRSRDNPERTCYDEAVSELALYGIKAEAFATYKYEEEYDERAMVLCPPYDKKIVADRVYYRLVLPLEPIDPSNRCNLTGYPVLVLLTTFAGVDPHELLLRSASTYNMSVFFGLPQPMVDYSQNQMHPAGPYFEFVQRLLTDHKLRYSNDNSLYTNLKGYAFSFEFPLLEVQNKNASVVDTLVKVGQYVHSYNKQLLISTYFNGNKLESISTVQDYINAFESLVNSKSVDVISVKDGRGSGNGAYFWPTQNNVVVEKSDAGLYQILKAKYSDIQENATYSDLFWTSVQQMFYYLADSRDKLVGLGNSVDLWLTIEAYDDLHDDPCLPVDISGSGVDKMVNRITKGRLDWALTQAGAYVQKVAARAWDPGFTCSTKGHQWPLRQQVVGDSGRPIIANCSFHNSFNRSVVVIGYNLDGLTQGFTVDWPNVNGHRVVSTDVHGYYFELDWGVAHHRVPSLMYTQLYDPYDVMNLAPKGYVKISANEAYHKCAFNYDFTTSSRNRDVSDNVKKYYTYVKKPKYRVYGQDTPFLKT